MLGIQAHQDSVTLGRGNRDNVVTAESQTGPGSGGPHATRLEADAILRAIAGNAHRNASAGHGAREIARHTLPYLPVTHVAGGGTEGFAMRGDHRPVLQSTNAVTDRNIPGLL